MSDIDIEADDVDGDAADTLEFTPALERDLRTSVVHPLLFPLDIRTRNPSTGVVSVSETITEVTIRRPTRADLKAIARLPENDADMALIGPLTGLSEKLADRLDAADLMDIAAIIGGFVKPGRKSGATTSGT